MEKRSQFNTLQNPTLPFPAPYSPSHGGGSDRDRAEQSKGKN